MKNCNNCKNNNKKKNEIRLQRSSFFLLLLRQTVKGTRQISINLLIYSQSISCQPPAAPPLSHPPAAVNKMLIGQNFWEQWLRAAVLLVAHGTSRRIFLPQQTVDSLPERESLQTLICARVQGAERDAVIDILSPRRRECRSADAARSRFMSAASCVPGLWVSGRCNVFSKYLSW